MCPTATGVHARIVFKGDVGGKLRVPVLEGIFGVPDHVVAPDDVGLR